MNERDQAAATNTPPAEGPQTAADSKNQGEGDYAADRRYRERTEHFLKTADVEQVARAAAPKSTAEAQAMAKAEEEGRAHAPLPAGQGLKQGDKAPGRH